MLQTNPHYLSESILLSKSAAAIHKNMLSDLDDLLNLLPKSVPVYIFCIPHAAQVNQRYLNNYIELGAEWPEPEAIGRVDYPFISEIENHFSNQSQITVVNPLKLFQQNDTFDDPLYLACDPHLTERGQEVLTQVLLKVWMSKQQ